MQRKNAEIGTKVVFKRDFNYCSSKDVARALAKIQEGDVFTISRILINRHTTKVELTTPAGELHTWNSGKAIKVAPRDLMTVEEALVEWTATFTYMNAREERNQRLKEASDKDKEVSESLHKRLKALGIHADLHKGKILLTNEDVLKMLTTMETPR